MAEYKFGNNELKRESLHIRSVRSTPSSTTFQAINVPPNDPVLNSQTLPWTTEAAFPTPTTQGQTTNNNPFILEIHPSPESEVTMPTLGDSTAYGTITTVGTAELQPKTTNTHQVINKPTIKPPPAHQQETTFQASITEEPVQAIQQPKATIYQPVNEEQGMTSDNRGMLVANTHGTKWYQNDPATFLEINGPVPEREFVINSRKTIEFSRGSDIQRTYSRLDYFLTMFPPPNSS